MHIESTTLWYSHKVTGEKDKLVKLAKYLYDNRDSEAQTIVMRDDENDEKWILTIEFTDVDTEELQFIINQMGE